MARFWKRRKTSDGGRETRHQRSADPRDKKSLRQHQEPTRSRPTNSGAPGTTKITKVRRNGKNYVRTTFKTGGYTKTTFRREGPTDKPGPKKKVVTKTKAIKPKKIKQQKLIKIKPIKKQKQIKLHKQRKLTQKQITLQLKLTGYIVLTVIVLQFMQNMYLFLQQ